MRNRQPQVPGKSKGNQPDAKDRGSNRNHLQEPAHGASAPPAPMPKPATHAHRAHQETQRVRAAVQYLRRKDRHEHHERPSHQADQREQQQDAANGQRLGDIDPIPGATAPSSSRRHAPTCLVRKTHHQQRNDHRDVADAIDQKAPALIGGGDEQACERWSDQSRHIHHRGIDGNRVGQDPRDFPPCGS